MSTLTRQYTAIAIVLHWAIAFAIAFNLALGFWMHLTAEHGQASAGVFEAFQLHKSVGLTVLALSLARLAWRLTHAPPPLPAHMPGWEKIVARATHWAFYALMIALPLSGWLYVSAGWSHEAGRPFSVPTIFFGLFPVPHLLGLAEQSLGARESAANAAFTAHWVLAYLTIALGVLHVVAALKHHFFDRDETLAHMIPGLKPPFATEPAVYDQGRLFTLGVGLGLTAIAAIALMSAALTLGGAAPVAADAPLQTIPTTTAPAAPAEPATETPPPPPAPSLGPPPAWRVEGGASAIRFSGVHAGTPFSGTFSDWSADIRFDPDRLDASSANVTIRTGSASDGVALHDQSLPQREWFDAADQPTATFQTRRIERRGDGYRASGALTIKGHTINLTLPFTLTINGDRAIMDGHATISRREADLGMESDPDGEWVSPDIDVAIHVEATRPQ